MGMCMVRAATITKTCLKTAALDTLRRYGARNPRGFPHPLRLLRSGTAQPIFARDVLMTGPMNQGQS